SGDQADLRRAARSRSDSAWRGEPRSDVPHPAPEAGRCADPGSQEWDALDHPVVQHLLEVVGDGVVQRAIPEAEFGAAARTVERQRVANVEVDELACET